MVRGVQVNVCRDDDQYTLYTCTYTFITLYIYAN